METIERNQRKILDPQLFFLYFYNPTKQIKQNPYLANVWKN